MSKSNTDPLFQLIQSLTKAEKRHFKLFTTRVKSNEDAKYLKLFDLIDKQKTYDETKILAKERSINPKQLPNLKAHLYKQILQALQILNTDEDIDIRIRELTDHVTILYNKGLYDHCIKLLDKAKELAKKYDKNHQLAVILDLEKKLVTKFIRSNIEGKVSSIIQESEFVHEKLHNINTFSSLSIKLYAFYLKIGFIRNQKDFELANSFLYSTLPAFKEEQLSFDEKMYLYNALVGYYFFIQDFERGYEYAKKWVSLFDEHPEIIASKTEMYMKGINNLMVAQSKLSKYDELQKTARKLDTIRTLPEVKINDNLRLLLFKYASTHEINKYFVLGQFTEGTRVIPEVEKGLDFFIDRLDKHYILIFYYKFACMYFGNDQYEKAIEYLNKVINDKDVDLRSDIHCFARILNLVSHYEMGNTDLADYYMKSTFRFLGKKDDLHLYQTNILRFLKKLNTIVTGEELTNAFKELREQLLPLVNNPYEKRAFIYFDIISWLESKIENRPVQEIIREKAVKRIKAYG